MNWKYLLVLLGTGWFLGAASGLLFMRFGPPLGLHAWHSKWMRERFYAKLTLTPEQKTKVDIVLQDTHQKLDRLRAEEQLKMDDLRSTTRLQVRQLLTAEQQRIFDRINAKKDEHSKKWRDRI